MPCDYSAYPADWPQLSKRIRVERAGGRCECSGQCGADHVLRSGSMHDDGDKRCAARNGDALGAGRGKVVLTVAHLCRPEDHDPPAKCGQEDHLLALCQGCHLRLDHPEHVRHARETRARRQGVQELPGFSACGSVKHATAAALAEVVKTAKGEAATVPIPGSTSGTPPPEPMPAISLWQPWATLVVIGAKEFETRDWPAPRKFWGRRIAIHAAKHWTRDEAELLEMTPFLPALRNEPKPLPLGAIVGTGILERCDRMESITWPALHSPERAFGAWSVGRWAWRFRDVQLFAKAVPCRGSQGFFEWTPPEPIDPVGEAMMREVELIDADDAAEDYPQQGASQHGVSREPVGAGKPARGATLPTPERDSLSCAVEAPACNPIAGEARDPQHPCPDRLDAPAAEGDASDVSAHDKSPADHRPETRVQIPQRAPTLQDPSSEEHHAEAVQAARPANRHDPEHGHAGGDGARVVSEVRLPLDLGAGAVEEHPQEKTRAGDQRRIASGKPAPLKRRGVIEEGPAFDAAAPVAVSDGGQDATGRAILAGMPLPANFAHRLEAGWTMGPISACAVCGRGVATVDPTGAPRHRSCERAAGVAP